jgi:hypothetical protein
MLRLILADAIRQGAKTVFLSENGSNPPLAYREVDGKVRPREIEGHREAFAVLGLELPFNSGDAAGYVVLNDRRIEYQASMIHHTGAEPGDGWEVTLHLAGSPSHRAEKYRADIIL